MDTSHGAGQHLGQAQQSSAARHIPEIEAVPQPSVPPRSAFLRSFVYAGAGLWEALRTQRNMRVHAAAALLAVLLGVVLRISPVEFAVVFLAIGGVLVAEMINTVAEAVVDLATREYHPLARVAKDVAAGAVLLSAIIAVIVALFIYLPPLLHLVGW
jgi:diacylglycerol kinase